MQVRFATIRFAERMVCAHSFSAVRPSKQTQTLFFSTKQKKGRLEITPLFS